VRVTFVAWLRVAPGFIRGHAFAGFRPRVTRTGCASTGFRPRSGAKRRGRRQV